MLGITGNWCQEASGERVINDVRHRLRSSDLEEEDEDVDESSFKGVCQLLNRLERKQAVQFRGLQELIEKLTLQVLSFPQSPYESANHSSAFAKDAVPAAAVETALDVLSKDLKGTGAAPSPHHSSTTPPALPEEATRGSAILLVPHPGAVDATAASINEPVVATNRGRLAAALPGPAACAACQNDTSLGNTLSKVKDVDSEPTRLPSKRSVATPRDEISGEMSSTKISTVAQMIRGKTIETSRAPLFRNYPSMRQWFSSFCRWLVRHRVFETFISTIIVLNSVEVGIQVEFNIRGLDTTWLHTMEGIFLVIYIFELVLRFMGDGWRIIKNGWILFDLIIVSAGIFALLLEAAKMGNWRPTFVKHVLIFRVLRLLRLIRALRLMHFMQVMGKLVNGLLQSMNAVISTSFLVVLFLYIFAVVGVEVMRQDEELNSLEVVQTHFHDVPVAMLTLSQFVTMDSLASIYFPIVCERPLLGLFFFPLVFLISIALMGLVAAFLLEAALDRAQTDKELRHRQVRSMVKKLRPDMRAAFRHIDTNNDGVISQEEVLAAYEFLPTSMAELLQAETLLEFFEMLDEDDSGDVDEYEFVENLLTAAVSDLPLETMQMLKLLRIQRRRMDNVVDQLHILSEHLLPTDREARQHRELEHVDVGIDSESNFQAIV